eukprot:CAMPEP_0183546688 /NCGR_PEP_ID=MMETSP0371-20130417/54978_1 /TAXON_ID=268820 /ORGANISM="Peridinium aciculiferum, Strain PAER-2" /LENGTH=54 /DNA_ID=CAMNT_0025749329 /DNA_START=58 /DNA_END=220 /DNA_ORIENTATION=+
MSPQRRGLVGHFAHVRDRACISSGRRLAEVATRQPAAGGLRKAGQARECLMADQ